QLREWLLNDPVTAGRSDRAPGSGARPSVNGPDPGPGPARPATGSTRFRPLAQMAARTTLTRRRRATARLRHTEPAGSGGETDERLMRPVARLDRRLHRRRPR